VKVLVISDVHGHKSRFDAIMEKHEDSKYIISLGDSELRHRILQKHDIIAIKGNYPFDAGFTYEHTMTIRGRRLLLVHGHKHKVKSGYEKLYHRILDTDADITLHGHVHAIRKEDISGRHVLSPGAVNHSRGAENPSYMVMVFNEDDVDVTWYGAEEHDEIKHCRLEV